VRRSSKALMLITHVGADASVLPPDGHALTCQDRVRIAWAILEKKYPTPTDFPASELGLAPASVLNLNNFFVPGR
jgi:hypothetical protein